MQARLLLLFASILLSLIALEAGAALWRARLHQIPKLSVAGPPPKAVDPDLPGQFKGQEARLPKVVPPLRILVIGESSGRGEPYHPWLSVAQIAAWRLEKIFPGRQIQVDMWAMGGGILETMHKKLAGLTYRPDALMVYVGHNEFQSRFAWKREVEHYLDDDKVTLGTRRQRAVNSFLNLSSLYQLLDETRERQRLSAMPPRMVTRELVDRPLCTSAETKAIAEDFRRRLASIALYCESIGTLAIFVIPPCNDGGWDPSRSVLAAETAARRRAAFAREVWHARALEAKDRLGAVRNYRELVTRHPEFAETHYRLARLLEQSGAGRKPGITTSRRVSWTACRCAVRSSFESLIARSRPDILPFCWSTDPRCSKPRAGTGSSTSASFTTLSIRT